MKAQITPKQLALLRWVAKSPPDGEATNPQRVSARALHTRRLIKVTGRGPNWRAEITEAGRHYLEHGEYPPIRTSAAPR